MSGFHGQEDTLLSQSFNQFTSQPAPGLLAKILGEDQPDGWYENVYLPNLEWNRRERARQEEEQRKQRDRRYIPAEEEPGPSDTQPPAPQP